MTDDEVLEAVRAIRADGRNATPKAIAAELSWNAEVSVPLASLVAPLAGLVREGRLFKLTADDEWIGGWSPLFRIIHYVAASAATGP